MTHYTLTDLEMADRHIAQGEQHIARQEMLLTSLQLKGCPLEDAAALLRLLTESQVEHRAHRDAIAAALDAPSSGGAGLR